MSDASTGHRRERLHANPGVWTVDDCVTPQEAQAICDLASSKFKAAVVSGAKSGVQSQGRTNSVAWVKHDASATSLAVAKRIADIVGLPLEQAENFQVIRYQSGQEYRPHFDAYDHQTERGQRTMQNGGQRLVTALCYLNGVEQGGETAFPKLEIKVAPKPGRLLIFENCEAGSDIRTPLSLHAGLPVEKGVKWAFNLWFRQRAIKRAR